MSRSSRPRRPIPAWLATPPEKVPWEQLRWLGIPPNDYPEWVMAPSFLNYGEAVRWAEAWAKRQGGEPELMPLSTGDTLVRLAR
jgi:hypothetical protein